MHAKTACSPSPNTRVQTIAASSTPTTRVTVTTSGSAARPSPWKANATTMLTPSSGYVGPTVRKYKVPIAWIAASSVNIPSHSAGRQQTSSPGTASRPIAIAAPRPTNARTRSGLPAPVASPTSVSTPAPTPYPNDISTKSRRVPRPYAARSAGPRRATTPVRTMSPMLLTDVESAAGTPTRTISRIGASPCRRRKTGTTRPRPPKTHAMRGRIASA